MAYDKNKRRPLSRLDQLRANNAAHRFYAGAAPDQVKAAAALSALPAVPPRRQVRRPVDGKPVGPSEHQLQAAVIAWWAHACNSYGLPEIALFAIPNGGARDVITGARLKAEGVRSGVVDLFLARKVGSYFGLFIEMKAGNNKPTDNQQKFLAYVRDAGYLASVHWSSESAIDAIKEYLQP